MLIKRDEKRIEDEASFGSTIDQPDKRPTENAKSSSTSSTASTRIPSAPSTPIASCM
ncbi:hypothetical protein DPMN_102242 [Dreissena polymorpha]|uniref:Uncharacterized protein n=1 Tax=Dreissena polymorpha TaxID=45954 RepID=A0A9D4LKR0_DREPO|nr:hypothetical protein DPMN_102242 [Dreissena polymorpha]